MLKLIKNCIECPLIQYDNEQGYLGCSFNDDMDDMNIPKEGIHPSCELINNPLIIQVEP